MPSTTTKAEERLSALEAQHKAATKALREAQAAYESAAHEAHEAERSAVEADALRGVDFSDEEATTAQQCAHEAQEESEVAEAEVERLQRRVSILEDRLETARPKAAHARADVIRENDIDPAVQKVATTLKRLAGQVEDLNSAMESLNEVLPVSERPNPDLRSLAKREWLKFDPRRGKTEVGEWFEAAQAAGYDVEL